MTSPTITKYRTAFLALVLVMIVAGIVAWWRFPGDTLTAQERMQDLCESAVYPETFDMVMTYKSTGSGRADSTAVFDVRSNGRNQHWIVSRDGSRFYEAVFIHPDSAGDSDSGARSNSSSSSALPAAYIRYDDDGEWGDWGVTLGEPSPPPSTAEQQLSPRSGGSEDSDDGTFCGLRVNIPGYEVEFRYVGQETIDGTLTHHYFQSHSPGGYGDYITMEEWLDSNGITKQTRRVSYSPAIPGSAEARVEHTNTFSNRGEENIITAPEGVTQPGPEPSATATPRPALATPEPTPEPEPTSTPVPTDTPEPTATPVPATAMLEPDPETAVFDGSEWLEFTVHGTGVERIDLGVNVWPGSTGAVGLTGSSSPPSVSEACESTSYTGYTLRDGWTVRLVGCQAGTVIIQLGRYVGDDYVLLRRYTVNVSGGP